MTFSFLFHGGNTFARDQNQFIPPSSLRPGHAANPLSKMQLHHDLKRVGLGPHVCTLESPHSHSAMASAD